MSDYLLRALLVILVLSALVGPLGSVAVWRRMGYFGDAAAHAALLGVAISLLFEMPIILGTGGVALLMAFFLSMRRDEEVSVDGLLGVVAHGALALAIILLGFSSQGRSNLEGYLFGSILTISGFDLWLFVLGAVAILLVLMTRWRALVYATLSEEMAAAHGMRPRLEARIYTVLLALAVAMGMQIVGALLMGAFLIIPAMAARRWAQSPESMALLASGIALFAGFGGFGAAYGLDIQAAPAMVVLACLVFLLSLIKKSG